MPTHPTTVPVRLFLCRGIAAGWELGFRASFLPHGGCGRVGSLAACLSLRLSRTAAGGRQADQQGRQAISQPWPWLGTWGTRTGRQIQRRRSGTTDHYETGGWSSPETGPTDHPLNRCPSATLPECPAEKKKEKNMRPTYVSIINLINNLELTRVQVVQL